MESHHMIADVPYEWPEWLTRLFRRNRKPVQPEILSPVQPTWMPTTEFERAVYAALGGSRSSKTWSVRPATARAESSDPLAPELEAPSAMAELFVWNCRPRLAACVKSRHARTYQGASAAIRAWPL